MVRESSKQGNDKVARQMEAAHRTSLAKGEVGIREKKRGSDASGFRRQAIPSLGREANAAELELQLSRS